MFETRNESYPFRRGTPCVVRLTELRAREEHHYRSQSPEPPHMFLAAVLAHHTAGEPHRQQSSQGLPEPVRAETPIRQSVREESQRRDTQRPGNGR
jgi:hypothetical protein